jgi:hypothetical protein
MTAPYKQMNPKTKERVRLGTGDREDPVVAEPLAVVNQDPELSRWFAKHCALCEAFRDKFRQIPVPPSHSKFSFAPGRFRV